MCGKRLQVTGSQKYGTFQMSRRIIPKRPTIRANSRLELVQRCILALSHERDLVLDPFLGVGSTAIGAILHNRRFVGFELDSDYLGTAKQRIRDFQAGLLKIRPLGKAVHEPTGGERVARIPDEWL